MCISKIKYTIPALILILTPEVIFFMKHLYNPSGHHPDKCIESGMTTNFDFNNKEGGFFINTALMRNSSKNCISPGFPTIKLKASNPINGWIQVIETDSKKNELKWFRFSSMGMHWFLF